ncbi:hypothetical protein JCGZ_19707 [Jatropha curcas]|uniref:Uncharacterized protein n=1 Tax=Jatropha curcas TaxID=180498 RepID=A0A067K665_JATCU|nr:hypothetical protein JCGZ_19707 [Jatropha curcas]
MPSGTSVPLISSLANLGVSTNQPKDSTAIKRIAITLKTTQTCASNPLNIKSTTYSSPNANIKTKSDVEIYVKTTPLPQQLVVAWPISGVCQEKHFPKVVNCFNNKIF